MNLICPFHICIFPATNVPFHATNSLCSHEALIPLRPPPCSAEKTKLMKNNISGINIEIEVNGQELETVTSFKYMGSVITDEGSKPKRLSMIA